MLSRYSVVIIFVKITYMLIPLSCIQVQNCSQELSRKARFIVSDLLDPVFLFNGREITSKCVFNPARDIYHRSEQRKNKLSDREFECTLCGKKFYAERYLDHHFARRHFPLLYTDSDSVCIADYCDLLRCNVYNPDHITQSQPYWDKAFCKSENMKFLKSSCEGISESCSDGDINLKKLLNHVLCDKLDCINYWKRPEHLRPMPVEKYIYYSAFTVLMLLGYYLVICVRCSRLDDASSTRLLKRSSLSLPKNHSFCTSDEESESSDCTFEVPRKKAFRRKVL